MRRLSRVVVSVTSVVSMTVLAGCGGGPPEAAPAPTPSASASASVATPVAPTIPSKVRSKSRAGAVATTRTFIEALNYAGSTGDTRQLRTLYIDFCTRCEAIADGIDKTYNDGGAIRGGEWTVRGTKFYSIQQNVAYVDAAVDYAPQEFIEASGAKPKSFAATTDVLKAFNLRWSPRGRWFVSAIDPEAS